MLLLKFFPLLIPLAAAIYRDNTKTMKTLPGFTNSLVNLGKMDLSFYFLAKPEDLKKLDNTDHSSGFFSPRMEHVEEPCACVSKFSRNFPKNHPSELLRKVMTSNDLFSFNREPETSLMCCESHENIREETILLDFSPKLSPVKEHSVQQNQLPFLPFIFDNFVTNKPTLPFKPKAVEILFFPKKKDLVTDVAKTKKKELNKEAIQIVGDKEIRNDFKTIDLTPPQPAQSSVKKDLGLQANGVNLNKKADGMKLITTAEIPNTL